MRKSLVLAMSVVSVSTSLLSAQTWVGPLNGSANDPTNWSGGVVPASESTVTFNNATSSAVFNGSLSVSTINFDNGTTTLDLNHYALTAGGTVNIASGTGASPQHANVLLKNGALTSGPLILGKGSYAVGELDIASGTTVQATQVRLGYQLNASGRIMLAGSGATLLATSTIEIGAMTAATGELALTDGASVQSSSAVRVGMGIGGYGSLTMRGAGTRLTATSLHFAESGTASMRIDSGALVNLVGMFDTASNPSVGTASIAIDDATVVCSAAALYLGTTEIANGGTLVTFAASATSISNGSLTLNDGSIVLASGCRLQNGGTLRGNGRIRGALYNTSTGLVTIGTGQSLLVDGTTTNSTNNGIIAISGGEFTVTRGFDNGSGGLITGRDATIRFGDGSSLLSYSASSGQVAFLAGSNNVVFGDLNVSSSAKITHTGNSTTTYYDDIVNNATVQTDAGSTANFLGSVSGSGTFTGAGTNVFFADMRPATARAHSRSTAPRSSIRARRSTSNSPARSPLNTTTSSRRATFSGRSH
ncbi:MAG: hypothetical protein QM770_00210 [Tepidisphaeraceae bacterium]